jgi:hypothetical protein
VKTVAHLRASSFVRSLAGNAERSRKICKRSRNRPRSTAATRARRAGRPRSPAVPRRPRRAVYLRERAEREERDREDSVSDSEIFIDTRETYGDTHPIPHLIAFHNLTRSTARQRHHQRGQLRPHGSLTEPDVRVAPDLSAHVPA